jgi:hypothetical protein
MVERDSKANVVRRAKTSSAVKKVESPLSRKWSQRMLREAESLKRALPKGQNERVLEIIRGMRDVAQGEMQEEPEERCMGVLHVSTNQNWSCHMEECELPYHALWTYEVFKKLPVADRVERTRRLGLCQGCLTVGHSTKVKECPYRKDDDELCPRKKCGRNHHKLLHMAGGMELGESSDCCGSGSVPASNPCNTRPALCSSGTAMKTPIQLMTQRIKNGEEDRVSRFVT